MKLQQLRYLVEVAKQGLNVSEAAEKLHTSQPGISKQIRLLEDELGVQIFIRNGKRVVDVTAPGREILRISERMLMQAQNLKRIGEEFVNVEGGSLTIATTHTQARYALPKAIKAFLARYPKVRLSIKQGSPTQISEMVVDGSADLAIATEGIDHYPELAMLDCYNWNRDVVVPVGHPLAALDHPITLDEIAAYPLITYDFAFTGRNKINRAFENEGLTPNVVLTAIDTDVIKTYVGLGLGVGIIASMAFEPERDTGLVAIEAGHLFDPSTTRIGIRRDAYLRGYAFDFIELFAPHLTRKQVQDALLCEISDGNEG
ncbi:LysR family transcriptional regulator, cys regulon transcriptional activator [Andreprevotia lacus DSM 23236]|jgi:LysR family cys regulon transcriptional activator|uniref:LysR family transcriptional regulator, cys regulon transcriptional activator n=1 Tax=Andreprevotia lacus DSM 23236 TaxID=1121001 RepID=A0A1W1X7C4_9NEIS|nr:HTH-type transcriptional regulator CysB [Andreprevotia lacus]SMC19825.1 LysR family transcriptional regulator, cys regulon transcriptional activator [Andreprevotia lacus DSM 23236]